MTIVDLFSGLRGWDYGLTQASNGQLLTVGIDIYPEAVASARANCHLCLQEDVRDAFAKGEHWQVDGLIASPPCQGFSTAGSGKSRFDSAAVLAEMHGLDTLEKVDAAIAKLTPVMTDPRTLLVLEPLRWILRDRPKFVAMEQVISVQPVWDKYADILRSVGYSVDTGVLHSEQFGVAQTRARSILIASLSRDVELPAPECSRYNPRKPMEMDPTLKPWVSISEALMLAEDGYLGFPRRYDRGTKVTIAGRDYRGRDLRSLEEPSHTVTGKSRSWTLFAGAGPAAERTAGQRRRSVAEPAHTITGAGTATLLDDESNYRLITPTEAAVLQSFPRDIILTGARTHQFQQVGNAIPPLVAAAVLESVI